MNMQQQIYQKLHASFAPSSLTVLDESHLHQGHAGVDKHESSHFRVRIKSSQFAGLIKLEIHRKINECLKQELADSIHALAIEVEK